VSHHHGHVPLCWIQPSNPFYLPAAAATAASLASVSALPLLYAATTSAQVLLHIDGLPHWEHLIGFLLVAIFLYPTNIHRPSSPFPSVMFISGSDVEIVFDRYGGSFTPVTGACAFNTRPPKVPQYFRLGSRLGRPARSRTGSWLEPRRTGELQPQIDVFL
jgi:hypothetical protein